MIEFARLITEASETLQELIISICDKKTEYKFNDLKVKIHTLEDESDFIFQQAISNLFQNEKDAILIIKWKDIFENLENIMDKYQKVSDIIGGIMVKSG